MRFANAAWPFVLPWPLIGLLFLGFGSAMGFVVCLIVSLAILLFFRIPPRPLLDLPAGTILAAANGKITEVNSVEAPFLGPGNYHHVVTFLSVFNVHVQRAPDAGTVISSRFTPGRKVAAFRKDAGDINENHQIIVQNAAGEQFAIKQIAGLLARRVVCSLSVGDEIERGQLIGLIKFGSRVDLYLPSSYQIEVRPNQTVCEGKTVIAGAGSKSG